MKYIIESTSHRINRRLHQEFSNFEDAKAFFNKVCRRPRSSIYLWDVSTGEILAIKNSLTSKLETYYSETYQSLLKVRRTK